LLNSSLPEGKTCAIRLGDAHDPLAREAIPEEKRGLTANAGAPVGTENEKLGDIQVSGIVGGGRASATATLTGFLNRGLKRLLKSSQSLLVSLGPYGYTTCL
jgi:hypothetical protein